MGALFLCPWGAWAKAPAYLADALKDAGGVVRFERLETVDWVFQLVVPSTSGVQSWEGRQRLRREGGGWWVREDLVTPQGTITVRRAVATTVDINGTPVDGDVRDRWLKGTERRAFFRLAPLVFSADIASDHYLGAGYFQTRLVRRLALDLKPGTGWPIAGPVTLLLDHDGSRFRGVSWGDGDGAESLLVDGHELNQNLLNLPRRWTRFNAEGKRMEILETEVLLFNVFVDPGLFATPAIAQGVTP